MDKRGMWKCNYTPKTGLMIKYLAQIMTDKQLKQLLKDYVAAKQKHFGHYNVVKGQKNRGKIN